MQQKAHLVRPVHHPLKAYGAIARRDLQRRAAEAVRGKGGGQRGGRYCEDTVEVKKNGFTVLYVWFYSMLFYGVFYFILWFYSMYVWFTVLYCMDSCVAGSVEVF